MDHLQRIATRTLTVVLVSVLTLAIQAMAHASTYDDVPSRSWQVDGRVYATAIVGDTVYVGGSFSRLTSPSGVVVTRPNLAAFSLSTGELRSGFTGNAGSSVRALVSDGTSLYVGGHFGRIAGVSRARLAKVDLVTGQVDTGFRADANGGVLSLALHDGQIYAGGAFTTIGGSPHTRLAKLDANSGAVDSGFAGSADNVVSSVVKHPTSNVVYAAGYFRALSGTSRYGVGAVSSQTGASTGPAFANSARPTLALSMNDDGTHLYGALASASNSVSAWRTGDGTRVWSHRTEGDVQAVTHHDGLVYFGFHDGFQGDHSLRLLAADARTGALDTQFRPAFDLFWGVFSVAASDEGLVAGGEFSQVSGVSARGLVIFPNRPGGGGTALSGEVLHLDGSQAAWSYWDRGELPSSWSGVDYADQDWATGSAQFGYGDGDEATVISYGPSGARKHITSYFRSTFTLTEIPDRLTIRLIADDGAVVHLNGIEAIRDNMLSGPLTASSLAATNRSGAAESQFRSFEVDPSGLIIGDNLVAIEVHQDQAGSSDLSMDADVIGTYSD